MLSCSFMSDSWLPHELQPAWLLWPLHSPARRLEWVAILFSRGSSWPRDWTWVSCIADSLLSEPPGKLPYNHMGMHNPAPCHTESLGFWDHYFKAWNHIIHSLCASCFFHENIVKNLFKPTAFVLTHSFY